MTNQKPPKKTTPKTQRRHQLDSKTPCPMASPKRSPAWPRPMHWCSSQRLLGQKKKVSPKDIWKQKRPCVYKPYVSPLFGIGEQTSHGVVEIFGGFLVLFAFMRPPWSDGRYPVQVAPGKKWCWEKGLDGDCGLEDFRCLFTFFSLSSGMFYWR